MKRTIIEEMNEFSPGSREGDAEMTIAFAIFPDETFS
jgi:hypothetical protein